MLRTCLSKVVKCQCTELWKNLCWTACGVYKHSLVQKNVKLTFVPMFRLSEEESASLLDLITCKAPATAAGVKFVSLGLCMFIACNSLISSLESERRVVAWIQWLVAQAAHFEQVRNLDLCCFLPLAHQLWFSVHGRWIMIASNIHFSLHNWLFCKDTYWGLCWFSMEKIYTVSQVFSKTKTNRLAVEFASLQEKHQHRPTY